MEAPYEYTGDRDLHIAPQIMTSLLEADFFDLVDRLCLMPVLLPQLPPGIETSESLYAAPELWIAFVCST
jgi:hypothetical protein